MKEIVGNKARREVWLEAALASISERTRILDAGAGELQYKRFCKHLDYVAQDFGQYDGQGSGDALQTGTWDNSKLDIVSDIAEIPEADGSFGAIMCIEVFEHIPHPICAIKEFSRLMAPGGTLIITAPVSSLTHFAPYYFYNGFSRYFYETHLKAAGFEIEKLEFNSNYFDYIAQEVRRSRKIGRQYSKVGFFRKQILKISGAIFAKQLRHLSKHDTGSSELLSFGVHVQARKI